MVDNNENTGTNPTGQEPIKSATDLEIEKLNARLDALENDNRELRQANQGLWAALHPAQDAPAQAPAQPATDGSFEALAKKLGLTEE